MPEPLHPGRLARRALRGVDPLQFVPKVVLRLRLRRLGFQLVNTGHYTDRRTAGIDQVDRRAAELLGQRAGFGAGRLGQAQHIGLVLRGDMRLRRISTGDLAGSALRPSWDRCRADTARRRCELRC